MSVFAAIKKAEGPITDLRPPKDRINFDLPESAILNGALIFAFLVLIVGRILHARRPPPPIVIEPAIQLALRALEVAAGPTIVEDTVQIVRRYLFNAFGIGPEGATTTELCAAFAAHPHADGESLDALETYFAESDLARFAPLEEPQIAATCVSRARTLIEKLEARRIAAEPPPLAVVT